MSSFPCLARFVSGSGQARYRLGDRLVDRYLEFVAGRCRPNTLRAVAFDLKTFFTVIGKGPVEVTAADVFDFLADQRGDRTVVRLADRESGLSARTIARRLSSVSGLYACLVARGDTAVRVNPVPRGLMTRRQGGTMRSSMAPLVRVPRTLPRILSPEEADRLVGALRTHRFLLCPLFGCKQRPRLARGLHPDGWHLDLRHGSPGAADQCDGDSGRFEHAVETVMAHQHPAAVSLDERTAAFGPNPIGYD